MTSNALLRPFVALGSAILVLVAASLAPGCGPGKPEFSPETKQTPESVAQEFAFRYQGLPAQASGKAKARATAIEKAKAKLALNPSEEKGKTASETTKKAPAATLDALLDAIEVKLDQIPGTPKAEAARKVLDLLKANPTIEESDRAVIAERLGKFAG